MKRFTAILLLSTILLLKEVFSSEPACIDPLDVGKTKGFIPNCQKYYQCEEADDKLQWQLKDCPAGLWYADDLGICVLDSRSCPRKLKPAQKLANFCLKIQDIDANTWSSAAADIVPQHGRLDIETHYYSDLVTTRSSIFVPLDIDEKKTVHAEEAISMLYQTKTMGSFHTFDAEMVKAGKRLYFHIKCPNGRSQYKQLSIPDYENNVTMSLYIRANGLYLSSTNLVQISDNCQLDPEDGYVDLVRIVNFKKTFPLFNWNKPRIQTCNCSPQDPPIAPETNDTCRFKALR